MKWPEHLAEEVERFAWRPPIPHSFVDAFESDLAAAATLPILDTVPPPMIEDNLGKPYEWGNLTAPAGWCVTALSACLPFSRQLLLDAGVIEGTPQENADAAASRERYREQAARAEYSRAAWYDAVMEAAGPVGRAALAEHIPNDLDLCEGDDFGGYDGAEPSWPCRTLQNASKAAGIPIPEDIW